MNSTAPSGPGSLQGVQHLRKRIILSLAVLVAAVALFTQSRWATSGSVHEVLEAVGWVLIALCIAGRTWCALYLGGRKKETVVDTGPYSLVRNPLYVFSIVGSAGVGFMAGSFVPAVLLAVLCFAVFDGVVRREEAFLRDHLGPAYAGYLARVPRWWPSPAGWRDDTELAVRPRLVLITFRDACIFALAGQLVEAVEWLQLAHILPVWLLTP